MLTMMRKVFGVLSVATVLTAVALSGSTDAAQARPISQQQRDCEAQGGDYDPKLGCGTKQCQTKDGGRHNPGTTRRIGTGDGSFVVRCNGHTGTWDIVLAHQAAGGIGHILTQSGPLVVLEPALAPVGAAVAP